MLACREIKKNWDVIYTNCMAIDGTLKLILADPNTFILYFLAESASIFHAGLSIGTTLLLYRLEDPVRCYHKTIERNSTPCRHPHVILITDRIKSAVVTV